MSSPIPSSVITGPSSDNGSGNLVAVRRSAIHSLEVHNYGVPPVYDADGNPLSDWVDRYAVIARASADQRVKVSDFASRADADAYITADPDGYIS